MPTLNSGKVWQIWSFAIILSNLLPLSRKLTPSLLYHIVRKQITKLTDFISFWPFGICIFPFLTIGISMYQKRILPHFIILLLSHPKLLPLWSGTDRRTDGQHSSPPLTLVLFFTERAGPYPQAQLYWAGRTMVWMADWTSNLSHIFFSLSSIFRERGHHEFHHPHR